MTASPLRLADATLADGTRADVHVADGRIAADPSRDARVIELGGSLLVPAFVDGHIHLDKSFLGTRWRPHEVRATLQGRIEAERAALLEVDAEVPIVERAVLLAKRAAGFGTGYLRSHVDVHPETGLTRLEAVLEARERLRDTCDVQVVAFPQRGVLAAPGTAALLDAAVRDGADATGRACSRDDELRVARDLVTNASARAIGVEGYGLQVGTRANLIAIAAPSAAEAVASPPDRLLVVHEGRIIAGTPG